MQRHTDVAHEDLHGGPRGLLVEEEQDSALSTNLRRLTDSLDQPGPTFRVGRLKRIVVALDPGPDDEVGAQFAGEVDRRKRLTQRLRPRSCVGRYEASTPEARIEMQAGGEAVDVV